MPARACSYDHEVIEDVPIDQLALYMGKRRIDVLLLLGNSVALGDVIKKAVIQRNKSKVREFFLHQRLDLKKFAFVPIHPSSSMNVNQQGSLIGGSSSREIHIHGLPPIAAVGFIEDLLGSQACRRRIGLTRK